MQQARLFANSNFIADVETRYIEGERQTYRVPQIGGRPILVNGPKEPDQVVFAVSTAVAINLNNVRYSLELENKEIKQLEIFNIRTHHESGYSVKIISAYAY